MAEVGKKMKRWRRLKRGLAMTVVLFGVATLLVYLFLPRIAERVIRGMIADAGLGEAQLRVVDIGWRRAVIEDVAVADGAWSVQVKRVRVGYDPFDLANGRMKSVQLDGVAVAVDWPAAASAPAQGVESGAGPGAGSAAEPVSFAMIHGLPDAMEKVGVIDADDVDILMRRGTRQMRRGVDVHVDQSRDGKLSATAVADDFKLDVVLSNRSGAAEESELTVLATATRPASFLDMLGLVIGSDQGLLPDGVQLAGAELAGTMKIRGDRLMPFGLTGTLNDVAYDGGANPVRLRSNSVIMKLQLDVGGAGRLDFAGKADSVTLREAAPAGIAMEQVDGARAGWKVGVAWGGENEGVSGSVRGLRMKGFYADRPVGLDRADLAFRWQGASLEIDGLLENGGVELPVVYKHTAEAPTVDRWLLRGRAVVGPVDHHRPMPVLNVLSDVFELVEFTGETMTTVDFSVGSHQAFRAEMKARLRDASVSVSGGRVRAEGVSGTWEMNVIPLPDDGSGPAEPSHYSLDFSAAKLVVATEEALGYDLCHQVDRPVTITGKGGWGMDGTRLDGEIKNLTLHGEKGGSAIDFEDTRIQYSLIGEVLAAEGVTSLGGNDLPFKYRHERTPAGDDWTLAGWFQLEDAALKEPVDNAVMLVEAMGGKTLSGMVSMKMDFTMGSHQDFDGRLTAAISGGTLSFADDGPVIEGLKGDIRLSSLKTKRTDGFHRVTATRIKAFDMELTGMRFDYQLLATGDIGLRNVAMGALGGEVWLDPFTLPAGDADYRFKVRAKKLDLAELAKLFPDFNGTVSGRLDGLLPMESVGGKIRPSRGGMYLTPRSKAKLKYDAGNAFSAGVDPKSEEYRKMKMVEDSLRNLDLKVLSIRLFDPRDKDKAVVLRLEGQASGVKGSPPIHLNINGFKPDDDTVDFFDLLLRHRDRLNFGL